MSSYQQKDRQNPWSCLYGIVLSSSLIVVGAAFVLRSVFLLSTFDLRLEWLALALLLVFLQLPVGRSVGFKLLPVAPRWFSSVVAPYVSLFSLLALFSAACLELLVNGVASFGNIYIWRIIVACVVFLFGLTSAILSLIFPTWRAVRFVSSTVLLFLSCGGALMVFTFAVGEQAGGV